MKKYDEQQIEPKPTETEELPQMKFELDPYLIQFFEDGGKLPSIQFTGF